MIFDILTFTLIHVALSLLGIIAGLVVAGGLIAGRRLDSWTGVFLWTTVLTNVTGFFFPFTTFLASHGVGVVSLLILPIALYAYYVAQLAGSWRRIYVISAITALYLNVFVLVVQLFRRVPAMLASAPTQQEAPFLITQLGTLALFIWLGRAAHKGFAADSVPRLPGAIPAAVAPNAPTK
jgi:hypothetical protein